MHIAPQLCTMPVSQHVYVLCDPFSVTYTSFKESTPDLVAAKKTLENAYGLYLKTRPTGGWDGEDIFYLLWMVNRR